MIKFACVFEVLVSYFQMPARCFLTEITNSQFKAMVHESKTFQELAVKCGYKVCTRPSGTKHGIHDPTKKRLEKRCKQLGLMFDHLSPRPTSWVETNFTDSQFEAMVRASITWNELYTKCGYKLATSSCPMRDDIKKYLTKRCKRLGLTIYHLRHGCTKRRSELKKNIANKTRRRPTTLKNRLLATGRSYRCEICHCKSDGFSMSAHSCTYLPNTFTVHPVSGNKKYSPPFQWLWHGNPIEFEIDHINGIDFEEADDEDNLRWLCSNCHSQQPTSTGRRVKPDSKRDIPPVTKHRKQKHIQNIVNSNRPYECANCKCEHMDGISDPVHDFWSWNKGPIKLEVNHINGRKIPDADNVDNLEWLCPNCHYQHTCANRKRATL